MRVLINAAKCSEATWVAAFYDGTAGDSGLLEGSAGGIGAVIVMDDEGAIED